MSRPIVQNKQTSCWPSKQAMVPGKQIVRAAYLNDNLEFKIFGALQVITKKGPVVDHYTLLGNCPATPPLSKY